MNTATGVVALAIAACLSGLTLQRWRAARPLAPVRASYIPSITTSRSAALDDSLAAATDLTIGNDPFRVSNTPSSVRFDAQSDAGAGSVAFTTTAPRPTLALKGVTGGPPWQAMVDGIPGQPPGTIVRTGARFDKLLVRAVTRDSVVLQGFDTTWVLRFAR